jgi:hypothetical protein
MKHPTIEPAANCTQEQAGRSEARTIRRANSPGHSRTLYTSIGPDQSNFIRKNEGEKNPAPQLAT